MPETDPTAGNGPRSSPAAARDPRAAPARGPSPSLQRWVWTIVPTVGIALLLSAALLSGVGAPAPTPVRETGDGSPVLLTQAQLQGLESTMPVDAKAVASNDTVWIAPGSPHLLILISPPGADDEFVIAGLVDPTIFVPHGVTLYVSVANLDTEDTHSWGITDHGPPFGNMPMMGSGSGPSWWGSSMMGLAGGGRYWSQDLSLTLVLPGTYWYVCLHPGHAADGMYGNLVVE